MTKTVPLETTTAGGCSCGHHEEEDLVLDVRPIPHAIRHATVFGAFDAIPVGGSLVLVVPHNPVPLLNQLAERSPIGVEYAFDVGQELTEHTAAMPVLLQVLDGRLGITADGRTEELLPGGLVHLDTRVPHAVFAHEPSLLVLTMRDGRAG